MDTLLPETKLNLMKLTQRYARDLGMSTLCTVLGTLVVIFKSFSDFWQRDDKGHS